MPGGGGLLERGASRLTQTASTSPDGAVLCFPWPRPCWPEPGFISHAGGRGVGVGVGGPPPAALEPGIHPSPWGHPTGSFGSSSDAATASWKACETLR